MARKQLYTIQGRVHWAKILGEPVPNYAKDGKEWTMDLTPDEEGLQVIRDLGLEKRIKNKGDDRGDFFAFRQKERRIDGSANRPIAVVDEDGAPWPQDKLLGNGTLVDVKFEYRDYGAGKHPGVYPQAVRVREYNEYVTQHFAPIEKAEGARAPVKAEQNKRQGQLPEGMEPELDDEFPV